SALPLSYRSRSRLRRTSATSDAQAQAQIADECWSCRIWRAACVLLWLAKSKMRDCGDAIMSETPPASDKGHPTPDLQADRRKARLAEQLRANLQRRKAQARSRRSGEADRRPEGLAAARAGEDGEAS